MHGKINKILCKNKIFRDCRHHCCKHLIITSQYCENHMCEIRPFVGGAWNGHNSISNVIVTTLFLTSHIPLCKRLNSMFTFNKPGYAST